MRIKRSTVMIVSISIIILITLWGNERKTLALPTGCLFGYDEQMGRVVMVSLTTGHANVLIPPEIQSNHRLYAPAFDPNTATIYYLNTNLHAVMSYTQGEAAPKTLYRLPGKSEREQHAVEDHIEWLLLSPTGETLLFSEYQQYDIPRYLIELSLESGQRRIVSRAWLLSSHRPAWVSPTVILVITSDHVLAILEVQTGNLTILLEHVGMFALSKTGTKLLVEYVSHREGLSASTLGTERFTLYDFPAMTIIKEFSPDIFHGVLNKYYLDDTFYFLGEHHVFFSLSTSGGRWFSKTCVLDIRTLTCQPFKWLHGMSYFPECPQ